MNWNRVLTDAINSNDLEHVRQAVANGVDLKRRNKNGFPPLCVAVGHGQLDIVKEVCTAASINVRDAEGKTPLWWAVYYRRTEIVNVLLAQEGVNVNKAVYFSLRTPLLLAVMRGHFEIVKALLKMSDIDVDREDHDGQTPLIVATTDGRIDVINALLDAGADVNNPGEYNMTPLHAVLEDGPDSYEIVLRLLQHGANPNALCGNHSPLVDFAINGNVRTTRLFIAAGTDLYDFEEPHKPIVEDVFWGVVSDDEFDSASVIDVAVVLYVALDNHDLSMQSIQRLERVVHMKVLLNIVRDKLNDEEIVADVKKQLSDEKTEWIMHGAKGQNRIVDVVMAMKPMCLPTLVIVEMLMFDNPRLAEVPFHVVWNQVEKIIRFKIQK